MKDRTSKIGTRQVATTKIYPGEIAIAQVRVDARAFMQGKNSILQRRAAEAE